MKWVVLDTETTGLDKKNDQICQLTYLILDKDFNIEQVKNFYLAVDKMDSKAEEVHGLSIKLLDKLSNGLRFEDISREIFKDLKGNGVICHNIPFDMELLQNKMFEVSEKAKLEHVKEFCSMKAYAPVLNLKRYNGELKNPRLGEVTDFLQIKKETAMELAKKHFNADNIGFHDSRYDTICTYLICKHLKEYKENKNK